MGDSREPESPGFFVPVRRTAVTAANGSVSYEYDVNSATEPSFVALSDGSNAVTVVSTGANQYALLVRDSAVRRLLERMSLTLDEINLKLAK